MPKARLGVALLLPPAVAAEIDGLRRAVGDGSLGRIPPHLTLVPPVNVREDRMADALAVLRAAAAGARPLTLRLGPPATFLPDNPVLYLAVGGAEGDLVGLRALRDAVFQDPLARPLTWPWVPHVTLADEADPARIEAALASLAGYQVDVVIDRVHLLQEGPGRVWEPVADAGFGPPAVVGRGGLPLELAVSDRLDPVAAALVVGAGRPFAVTARRDGTVVGAAAGATSADVGELAWLQIHPEHRGEGAGAHLLAAVVSLAAERGCTTVVATEPTAAILGTFLRRAGWLEDAGGRLCRRV